MREYSDSEFEKKLMLLKSTRDLIKSLSTWCFERHEHYKSIISVWFNAILKATIQKRLTLFYLANDIINHSKKKNYKFIDGWATTIKKAIPYVRHEKIQFKIARIINVWKKLGVYDNGYLANLTNLLTTPNPVQEFQVQALAVKIRSCVKLEQIIGWQMNNLREANFPLTNNEASENMLKDRTSSQEFFNELNNGVSTIQSFIKCIKQETIDRARLIDALELATSYYAEHYNEVKIVAQAYFDYTKRVKLLQSKLQYLVGSMPTYSTTLSPNINAPPPLTSPVSIEDVKINYNTVLINSDKNMTKTLMENNANVPTTVIDGIKSYITPDMHTTAQELYDPASVSFPLIENRDQQSLTSQFPYDVPSTSSDETFARSAFPNKKNVSYTNMNNYNKTPTYCTSIFEASVPTKMSSSQQLLTSEFSNIMVPPTSLSSIINENTKPVFNVPQRVWDKTVHSDWLTNDTPASPPFIEKIPYKNTSIISKTDGKLGINHCILPSKTMDSNERVFQGMITKTSHIDPRNLISLTNGRHMNSSMVPVDVDNRTFPGISISPSSLDFFMEAVSKPQTNNVESVDMNLSDDYEMPKSNHDQKNHVVLPLPLPPPIPFEYNQQRVPDVTNQWQQPSQIWSNERPSFYDSQFDIEQSDEWKHPYQWEQKQSDSNFVLNPPNLQWPQHIQKNQSKGNFRPKWKSRICNWRRGTINFIPRSTPTGRWNQGPRFGPRNRPW